MNTYELVGREYPVLHGVQSKVAGGIVPVLDIQLMSDYDCQKIALESRLEHPEYYEGSEDVAAVIMRLQKWLADHAAEAQT